MAKFRKLELTNIKTVSIRDRKSKVQRSDFAHVFDPKRESFSAFVKSLPRILTAEELRHFVDDIAKAHKKKKPILLMLGAHVIKVGLSPLIIDLVKRKIITAVAMNSAAAIHDVETAMWGKTSEDVAETIVDGTFGMSRETGDFINQMLSKAFRTSDIGYGEALAQRLIEAKAPYRRVSVLAACYRLDVPITVHVAIGTDIVHQQSTMNGAATGEMSFRDFKVLCNVVKDLRGGGVVINLGSAVIMPEVFLKALTVARNLGYNAKGFTTANFDMIQHYRPRMNVVLRPTQEGGRGFQFTGHHEIMIPLLAAMIKMKIH